jgi:ABC-type glutathione transport system ATPase component
MDASTSSTSTPLLQLRGIDKRFVQPVDLAGRIANLLGAKNAPAVVHAVAGVDLDIQAGEVIGVVGESGCGKSTLGRVIAGINPPTAGEVSYKGKRLQDMSAEERKAYGLGVQMIFQNPMASLNPRMRVLDIWTPTTASATRTSSPAASASASASRGPWRSSRSSSSVTRPWRRWTSRSRPRCSTCSWNCAALSS